LKTKLFERISPKKTIEGFVGGLLFSVIASYLVSKYYIEIAEGNIYLDHNRLNSGRFGTIGDLMSQIQTNCRRKDSGKIMPGHGGVLDRLDSVIFVAPIIFLFYQILNYVS
jgi:phosphatidate cytidylyltransferase